MPSSPRTFPHVTKLRFRVIVGDISYVQNHIRFDHFFKGGAEGCYQHGRQIGDEPDPIRKINASAVRSWTARKVGSRVANSMSAESTLAAVIRLKRVDLPASAYPTSAMIG